MAGGVQRQFAAKSIYERIMPQLDEYYPKPELAKKYLNILADDKIKLLDKVPKVIEFINRLSK